LRAFFCAPWRYRRDAPDKLLNVLIELEPEILILGNREQPVIALLNVDIPALQEILFGFWVLSSVIETRPIFCERLVALSPCRLVALSPWVRGIFA